MMTDSPAPSSQVPRGGARLYLLLLAVETLGAVLVFTEGLPIYRKTLADPSSFEHRTTGIALAGSALIQIAYWTRYRLRPEMPRLANAILAHVVQFIARLVFTLPTAIFSFLFIAKTAKLEMPAAKYAFILFALFSLFCYVRELENLGSALARVSRQAGSD